MTSSNLSALQQLQQLSNRLVTASHGTLSFYSLLEVLSRSHGHLALLSKSPSKQDVEAISSFGMALAKALVLVESQIPGGSEVRLIHPSGFELFIDRRHPTSGEVIFFSEPESDFLLIRFTAEPVLFGTRRVFKINTETSII